MRRVVGRFDCEDIVRLEALRLRFPKATAAVIRVLCRMGRDATEKPDAPLPSLVIAPKLTEVLPAAPAEVRDTLRARIVAAIEAHPGEMFTPARLAPVVGSRNRDSIRNTLLVLAAKGLIDKRGAGQYQAREGSAS